MNVILTHNNADFDAAAALLAAHKLNPHAVPVLPKYLRRNVNEFITLYQNGLPFIRWDDFKARKIDHVTLVDTQKVPSIQHLKARTPIHIIDHHQLMRSAEPHETIYCEEVGAATTLLVERIQQQGIRLNSLEATLLALGIYEDTGSLSYAPTTARDIRAAAWLLEQQASLETVRRFLSPPLTDEQERLFELLLENIEHRTIQGYTISVAAARVEGHIPEINSVAHRLRDVLDPAALFVVVQMPNSIHLVCRATAEVVDVGEVARSFGGGGHRNAAAATIRDDQTALENVVSSLWQQLYLHVQPVTRVADLMSFGVQTVTPDRPIRDIIQQMRRIGHEGYPVVEAGRVIGLLTRREADRAVEHGLGHLTVRDIMSAGEVTLSLDDSVSTLEQTLVTSGWGQIPVADHDGNLAGIVTRTDLIKHWARTHPAASAVQPHVSLDEIENVIGAGPAALINAVALLAQEANVRLYLVGGAVRDLLLRRRNLDLDFVAEGSAIHLAEALRSRFGGRVSSHRPFGTAKWILDAEVTAKLGISPGTLPDHVDFATSRNEFYEHPTALPTVYNSSIKLDLQRRDFTINTLAVQLSPAGALGHILDFYNGLQDLDQRLIRVLHSLSFVDDPTRILRAVRFEHRLGFLIETRTAQLIETALPMLRRITGERLRNELTLLLREEEPEKGLLKLQRRGITEAIHPAFVFDEQVAGAFENARELVLPWPVPALDMAAFYWHVIACAAPFDKLHFLLERLVFGKTQMQSMLDAARLVHTPGPLTDPQARPSQIVNLLDGRAEIGLLTAWLMCAHELMRERLQRYMLEWRHIYPITNGHSLRELGLPPGPRYRVILDALRAARLDGQINTDDEERELLEKLIAEEDSP